VSEHLIIELVSIIVLGFLAQWIAWRIKIPSIILLLFFGFLAGPVTGFLQPDMMLGDLLFPFVSLSVAIILFEGGLNLKWSEFRRIGTALTRLVLLGSLIVWLIAAVSARFLLQLEWNISLLLGAILVVTGPTVVLPLLRHIQPKGRLGSILKWEGIFIDPIGALLAVLVFEFIVMKNPTHATLLTAFAIGKTVAIGIALSAMGAFLIIYFMRTYLIPDYMQNLMSLSIVLLMFIVSNLVQEESGLLTATLMGIILANQKKVIIEHIVEFKENLQLLLVSVLFIILSARITLEEIKLLSVGSLLFLSVLIFIGRPLQVFLTTFNCGLKWREKVFLSAMAPRGIVAAAVSSLFGLELFRKGVPDAEVLTPLTFLVIVGTVSFYGFISVPLARLLKVAEPFPQGILMVGAHPWARKIASFLKSRGFTILLVDTNIDNIRAARHSRIASYHGNILADTTMEELELTGIGRLMAVTPNDEVNSLAVIHWIDRFDRSGVFQLAPEEEKMEEDVARSLRGRILFAPNLTYRRLNRYFRRGWKLKEFQVKEHPDWEEITQSLHHHLFLLFVITASEELEIQSVDNPIKPVAGDRVICLVSPSALQSIDWE